MKKQSKPKSPPGLYVKTSTWSRDSHGLYDYESRSVHTKQLQISSSAYLYRKGQEILTLKTLSDSSPSDSFSPLCMISQENSEFTLTSSSEPIWAIAKTMNSQYGAGAILLVGDIVKLGRVTLRVASINTTVSKELNDKAHINYEILNNEESGCCRICFVDDSEPENPLISPCKCTGSMKYIHLGCLQQWIASRMTGRNTENCVTYSWKSMDCEICKASLPFTIGCGERRLDLLKIDVPSKPFIVLEAVGNDKNSNRAVHLISMNGEKRITLGRGHEADVRISDISVSRCHAIMKFKDGCFILEDNNSKFGTLLRVDKKFSIKKSCALAVQIGRTVISLSTKGMDLDLLRL